MKKIYLFTMLLMTSIVIKAQIVSTTFRGAFEPSKPMWTDNWTNFDPQNTVYSGLATATAVTADITANTTWTTGNTYYLKSQIYVTNNAILTIEPGVIVFGDKTATGAGLFITRGSKLNAVGTANQPIVFTSDQAPGSRNKGDWGGIILLGKGSYNINNGSNNIEGIATSPKTKYGADTTLGEVADDNDNSGTMKYVRIEFGGYIYVAGSEINGLTFGAVGRGTTIDYVQCSNTNDDSFEWFGGAVNCTHLVAFAGLDDDFDTDNGFSGNVQFCLGVRDPAIADNPTAPVGASTSEGFESDNNAGSTAGTSFTTAIFTNCTMVGPTYRATLPNGSAVAVGYERGARLRRNTKLKIYNSIFLDYKKGLQVADVTTEANALTTKDLVYKNNIQAGITTPNTATANYDGAYVNTASNYGPINTWYAASNNTTVATNANILVKPYDITNGKVFTGLDYRPTSVSIAATGADFTDSYIATKVSGTLATTNFNVEDKTNKFNVYPNSFENTFKLSYSTTSTEKILVNVYDLSGKQIEVHTVAPSDFKNLELGNNYNTGIYFVKIKQGQTEKTVRAIKK
jgi:Secretion system C-terminal sorting domain